ncbi:MAG: carboxypeptidase regulatory-like domain-containing protein [Pseudomonadota bacterium]
MYFSSYGFWRAVIEADEEAVSFASVTLTAGGLPPEATLSGVVTDALTGDPLIGAGADLDSGAHAASTDSDGRFTIADLEPGFYELAVNHEGYVGHGFTIALGLEEPDLEIALYPVYDDAPEGPDEVEPAAAAARFCGERDHG